MDIDNWYIHIHLPKGEKIPAKLEKSIYALRRKYNFSVDISYSKYYPLGED